MGAYEAGTLFRTLVGSVGVKWALTIITVAAIVVASKKSVAWFFSEVVRLLGEWVKSQTDEKKALLQQNQDYARQINTFLTNHLAHVKEERDEHRADMDKRDAMLRTLSEGQVKMNGLLYETMTEVKEHRKEDQRRAEG